MLTAAYTSFAGGMNAATDNPRTMQAGEARLLVNATVRSGFCAPRPAWQYIPLRFESAKAQELFSRSTCQGVAFYDSPEGPCIVSAFAGHLALTRIDTLQTFHLFPKGWDPDQPLFVPTRQRIAFQQRGRYLVCQDGTSRPVILDGSTAFYQLNERGRVPVGPLMTEGWHRLVVSSHDRRRIYFSDHLLAGQGPLSFTEETAYFLNARYFEIPAQLGRIVALSFSPSLNGSKRHGPLLAFCERGTMAYDVSIPRDAWLAQDISSMILPETGAASPDSITTRGTQVFFTDQEGRIQSLSAAIADFTDARIQPVDLPIASLSTGRRDFHRRHAVTFDERSLFTLWPEHVRRPDHSVSVRHNAIAVYNHQSILPGVPPVWDGLWTGCHPVALVTGFDGSQTFAAALSLDDDGMHRFYRLTTEAGDDQNQNGSSPVTLQANLQPLDFGLPLRQKTLTAAALRLSHMRGDIRLEGHWQTDGQPRSWFTHTERHACQFLGCGSNLPVRSRLSLPTPPADSFHRAFPILRVTGHATLEDIAFEADDSRESSRLPNTSPVCGDHANPSPLTPCTPF